MTILRRRLLQSLPLLSFVAAKPQSSDGDVTTTDLVLNCDTAAVPALAHAAERFHASAGVRVRIFPTSPGLLVPQLVRRVQNDLLVTQAPLLRAAAEAGLIAGEAAGAWRNRFVLAAKRGAGADALKGPVAVPDPTPAADVDGLAVIGALALGDVPIRGALDTDEVAFLIARGEVKAGLLHAADLPSRPGLEAIRHLPDSVAPPVVYRAAVTTLARRPNPRAFLDFLLSPEGRSALTAQGLEIAA